MLVVTCGSGQVAGSDSASWPPCLRGRPLVPGWRDGAGSCITRSLRSRPSSSTGRSASSQASRVTSYPASKTTRIRQVTLPPVPGLDQPGHDLADLGGGHLGLVVIRAQAHRVQRRGPGGAARLQRRDHRVRPARDHLRLALPAAVDMAEQPLRAGRRVRPQPVAHIYRQPDPPVGARGSGSPASDRRSRPMRSGRGSQRHTARHGRAGALAPATAPPASGPARPRTAPRQPARTAHRPGRPGRLEIQPEPRQRGQGLDTSGCSSKLSITAFVAIICPLARTHDHAKAVFTHRDTPGKPAKSLVRNPEG